MNTPNKNASTKRGRPATGKGQQVVVRLQPDDLELLDLWIAANEPNVSRPEAMRRILRLVAMRFDDDQPPTGQSV